MAKKNNYNTSKDNVTNSVIEENKLEKNVEVVKELPKDKIIPEILNGHEDPVGEPGIPGVLEKETENTPNDVTETEMENKEEEETVEVEEEIMEDEEVNQNYKIGAELKLGSLRSDLDEIVRKNPELGSVEKVNEMLSRPESMSISLFSSSSTKSMEVSLMEKRDYYEIGGFEGKYMPAEANLGFYKSPQKSFNLALDQVKILIEKGYRLKNNRTGDVIKKRNVDEYISKWSKDKNPIISNKVYY